MASENDDDDDARDARVAAVATTCAPCELRPRAFFVAWSGVLALAFEGFPPAIASAKRARAMHKNSVCVYTRTRSKEKKQVTAQQSCVYTSELVFLALARDSVSIVKP